MNKVMSPYKLIFVLLIFITTSALSQNAVWKGTSDNDFFNELNWIVEGTQNPLPAGSLEENVAIDYNLKVDQKNFVLPADLALSFTSGKGITLSNAVLDAGSILSGYVKCNAKATLILRATTPLGTEASLQLEDNYSWIKLIKVGANEAASVYLAKITSKGNPLVLNQDVLINQYYFKGSLIRLNDTNFNALTLYDGSGLTGETFTVKPYQIISATQLGAFNNKASSFRLERGYQVVMSIYQIGIGKSETYIASEEALEIDLPVALNNTISFIRVMPWNWVTKKGANKFKEIGNTWTYNWNNNSASLPEMEYAPMAWGFSGASATAVANYINMRKVTHVLGFNESDNCSGQSGQFNNLCDINVAVPTFENLMRTGLRLASPSPRENGPFTWLKDFRNLAVQKDVRYDVLGVHWYDWGGNPVNTPFEDPVKIFNRFKNYLSNVYAEHKMPIWITEFNANPNRDVSVHLAFLELALPYLESLDYIERYDFFEPMPENAGNRTDITYATFYDTDGNITPLGIYYRDFESTPSVPEATFKGSGLLAGLNNKIILKMQADKTALAEGQLMTLTFTTDRTVGAPENFVVQVNLDDKQYALSAATVTIPEGGNTAQIKLTAIDDELVEELMNGNITLTSLSSGIDWDKNGISFTITSDDKVVVGILDEPDALKIYPNPTNQLIQIEATESIAALSITSMDGREIKGIELNGNTIDLLGLKPGMYLLKLAFANGELINKRIVKY